MQSRAPIDFGDRGRVNAETSWTQHLPAAVVSLALSSCFFFYCPFYFFHSSIYPSSIHPSFHPSFLPSIHSSIPTSLHSVPSVYISVCLCIKFQESKVQEFVYLTKSIGKFDSQTCMSITYLEAANMSNLDSCPRNQGSPPFALLCALFKSHTHSLLLTYPIADSQSEFLTWRLMMPPPASRDRSGIFREYLLLAFKFPRMSWATGSHLSLSCAMQRNKCVQVTSTVGFI